jgi:hypothetical protein
VLGIERRALHARQVLYHSPSTPGCMEGYLPKVQRASAPARLCGVEVRMEGTSEKYKFQSQSTQAQILALLPLKKLGYVLRKLT